jgi:hypothetical protein
MNRVIRLPIVLNIVFGVNYNETRWLLCDCVHVQYKGVSVRMCHRGFPSLY